MRYAGSAATVRWMTAKAHLADNTKPFRPVALAGAVDYVVSKAKKRIGALLGCFKRYSKSGWIAMRAGLLRQFAGCTHREIGLRVHRHTSTAYHDVKDHVNLTAQSLDYSVLAANLGAKVLNLMR